MMVGASMKVLLADVAPEHVADVLRVAAAHLGLPDTLSGGSGGSVFALPAAVGPRLDQAVAAAGYPIAEGMALCTASLSAHAVVKS